MFGLNRLFALYHMMRFVLRYGPDLAAAVARDIPLEDAAAEALEKWDSEGVLLTYRHHILLRQLVQEGAVPAEGAETCIAVTDLRDLRSKLAAFAQGGSGSLEFLIALPALTESKMSERSRRKLQEFRRDVKLLAKSFRGAMACIHALSDEELQ